MFLSPFKVYQSRIVIMTFVVSVAHTNFLCVAYNATTIYAQLSNPWIKSHTYVLRHAAVWQQCAAERSDLSNI